MKTDLTERARRYIAKLSPSIQGQNGSKAMFDVARVLKSTFSLPDEEAFILAKEWNSAHAVPPWGDAELRHKLSSVSVRNRSASGKTAVTASVAGVVAAPYDRSSGTDLNGPVPREAGKAGGFLEVARRSLASLTYSLAAENADPALSEAKQLAYKKQQRDQWPELRRMPLGVMGEVAQLRNLPIEVIHQAHSLGILRAGEVDGHRCLILRAPNFAQARRLDGGKLTVKGREKKAKNLLGSEGSFFGRHLIGVAPSPILLVEGCIGILEALAAIRFVEDAEGKISRWTLLAAVSAASRFNDEWLWVLKGRRIRILPDPGPAGMEFCGIATASLRSAGCAVDAFRLPDGIGDLGPIVAEPNRYSNLLKSIFTL